MKDVHISRDYTVKPLLVYKQYNMECFHIQLKSRTTILDIWSNTDI